MKILVVEDDTYIHNLVKEILTNEEHEVISAYSGTEAMYVLEKEKPSLIILDLMLPGLNGEAIIEKVKNIPIIVMSAKTSSDSKVNALLNGANDYITKPFDTAELLARVKVQLRMNEHTSSQHELIYKDLMLKDDHTLCVGEKSVHLTNTEYAILKNLLLNPSQVMTKSHLLELIALDSLDGDETSLKVHISNLRKKIRTVSETEYIESVWGIGFKLVD